MNVKIERYIHKLENYYYNPNKQYSSVVMKLPRSLNSHTLEIIQTLGRHGFFAKQSTRSAGCLAAIIGIKRVNVIEIWR